MDERLQDRIDEYILGRMSAEDRKTFEEELKKDKSLLEQYNYTKMVKETVGELAQLRHNMSLWDEEIKEERREEEIRVACSARPAACAERAAIPKMQQADVASKPRRRIWLWVSGIAAILVVGLFVVNPFSTSESDFQYRGTTVGNGVRGAGDMGEIENLIANKQYGEALTMIEEAEREMQGTAYQYNDGVGNYGEEEREQKEYEREEYQQRKDDLTWLKANALVGLGRKNEALALLDLLRNGNSEYKDNAESLYKQLSK